MSGRTCRSPPIIIFDDGGRERAPKEALNGNEIFPNSLDAIGLVVTDEQHVRSLSEDVDGGVGGYPTSAVRADRASARPDRSATLN